MSLVTVGLLILVLGTSMGTKEKSKVTRKKPIAVTDPQCMRTLEEWINLEREVLAKVVQGGEITIRWHTFGDGKEFNAILQTTEHSRPSRHSRHEYGDTPTHSTNRVMFGGASSFPRPNHIRGDWHDQPTTTYHHKSAHSTSRQKT